MKKIIIVLLIISSFITINLKAQTSKVLDMSYKRQNTQVWCWAASIAMVYSYYRNEVYDCQILTQYFQTDCCNFPSLCFRGGQPNEIPFILNVNNINTTTIYRCLTFDEIVEEIDNSQPIIAWVANSAFSAHVVVISGYNSETNKIRVLDPFFGRFWKDYDTFVANWQTGVWTISYTTSY